MLLFFWVKDEPKLGKVTQKPHDGSSVSVQCRHSQTSHEAPTGKEWNNPHRQRPENRGLMVKAGYRTIHFPETRTGAIRVLLNSTPEATVSRVNVHSARWNQGLATKAEKLQHIPSKILVLLLGLW